MKALVFTQYGPPEGLELKDVAVPQPADNQVLVKVCASSVNSWDWEYLNGTPFVNRLMFGLFKPRPEKQRLGADIAGTVEVVGAQVTRFKAGDAVFGDLWDNWGGFAEYACIDETGLEIKPANVTFEQAAAVPQAGVLALQGILKGGDLSPGKRVLINGAGGGVGTFAIQIAKLSGAEITGVDAAHKLDVIRALGADHAIDYAQEDFTKTGERYDLIIDCQNTRSMVENRRALRPGGTYAMIGGSMTGVFQIWLRTLFARFSRDDRTVCLVAEGPNKGLGYLGELLAAGQLVPSIDSVYTLEAVPAALTYFGTGRHQGKIAITINIIEK